MGLWGGCDAAGGSCLGPRLCPNCEAGAMDRPSSRGYHPTSDQNCHTSFGDASNLHYHSSIHSSTTVTSATSECHHNHCQWISSPSQRLQPSESEDAAHQCDATSYHRPCNHHHSGASSPPQSYQHGKRRLVVRQQSCRMAWCLALVSVLLLSGAAIQSADACSSRSTPKPRANGPSAGQQGSHLRPNITFQTYACPPAYAAWYCLNSATCFTVKIADSILYNCECADGFMGQRCEFKDLDGTYLPTRERLIQVFSQLGHNGSSLGQALAVVVVVVVAAMLLSAAWTRNRSSNRNKRAAEEEEDYRPHLGGDWGPDTIVETRGGHPFHASRDAQISPPYSISGRCDFVRPYNFNNNQSFSGSSSLHNSLNGSCMDSSSGKQSLTAMVDLRSVQERSRHRLSLVM